MSLEIPTFATVLARVRADVDTYLPEEDARVYGGLPYVMGYAIAAVSWGLWSFLGRVLDEALPDKSTDAQLNRQAAVYGITRLVATQATGTVRFSGIAGATIPAGTTVERLADGWEYTTDALGTIGAGGTVDVAVTAVDVGADGNAVALTRMVLPTPISGVASDTPIVPSTSEISGGLDAETDEHLRLRVLQRMAEPPQVGSSGDYERWTLGALATVEHVWVAPATPSAGSVTVYFAIRTEPTADEPQLDAPSAGDVSAVDTAIQAQGPVGAVKIVGTVTKVPIDMTIQLNPNTMAAQNDVTQALHEFFLGEVQEQSEVGHTIRPSRISEAISLADSEISHDLQTVEGVTPPAPAGVSIAVDEIATLGTIIWV